MAYRWRVIGGLTSDKTFGSNVAPPILPDFPSRLGFPQKKLIQGKCDSSFPTYDGSCNHPNNFSRAMSSYKRLVAAEYCDNQHQPRCSTRGRELPSEVSFEFSVKLKIYGHLRPFTFMGQRVKKLNHFSANNFNNNETRRWSSKSKSKCLLPFHCLGPILNPRYYSNTRCR